MTQKRKVVLSGVAALACAGVAMFYMRSIRNRKLQVQLTRFAGRKDSVTEFRSLFGDLSPSQFATVFNRLHQATSRNNDCPRFMNSAPANSVHRRPSRHLSWR